MSINIPSIWSYYNRKILPVKQGQKVYLSVSHHCMDRLSSNPADSLPVTADDARRINSVYHSMARSASRAKTLQTKDLFN